MVSVLYKNPELYHTKELPLKSLVGAISSVILWASCGCWLPNSLETAQYPDIIAFLYKAW